MTHVDATEAIYAVDALIAGRRAASTIPAPRPLALHEWPPDYGATVAWRERQLAAFEADPALLRSARAWYAARGVSDPVVIAERVSAWICHWCDTYDPRLIGTGRPTSMPFILFQRQHELVTFIVACMYGDAPGLVEKSRDMGATWVGCAFLVWAWLYQPGFVGGVGSNKAEQVDVLGNPKSIFEKLRMLIRRLPVGIRPPLEKIELKQYTCRNLDNGAVIDGEIGKNIGRGGRSRIYIVDEAAHLEQPDAVEAALSENTRCRIDLSSVSGAGTVFHRKRLVGAVWRPGAPVRRDVSNVFEMDWRDHPDKTEEWYTARRAYFEAQGTPHVVAREIDRDYAGAAEGIIIKYDWVEAAVDAHETLGFDDAGGWWGGLDVADEGVDVNTLVRGRGVVVKHAEEWGERDPGVTARRALRSCRETSPIELMYDAIGIGAAVKSEINRIRIDEGVDLRGVHATPWIASAAVLDASEPIIKGDKDAPTNKNYFENFKAQAWWHVAQRFYKTWQAVTYARGASEVAVSYDPGDLISISTEVPRDVRLKLMRELTQATWTQSGRLRMMVDKQPDGAKSPNLADALVMGLFPARAPRPAGRIGAVGMKLIRG